MPEPVETYSLVFACEQCGTFGAARFPGGWLCEPCAIAEAVREVVVYMERMRRAVTHRPRVILLVSDLEDVSRETGERDD